MTPVPPLYLSEVEKNPQPGPYRDLIEAARKAGKEYWPIWHLFSFRPEVTAHLMRFTQGVMHDDAPISPGLRELIAAYVSSLNDCAFCRNCHAEVAAELLQDHSLVGEVLRDLEGSRLPEKEKALLRFVRKITLNLPQSRE